MVATKDTTGIIYELTEEELTNLLGDIPLSDDDLEKISGSSLDCAGCLSVSEVYHTY